MTEETSTFKRRHEYLGSIVLRLLPKIMQTILKGHIIPKVLKMKYKTKKLKLALTDAEIALMEQLPNIDNFTVVLCYNILRYEQLVDDPKCDWINEPHDTEIEIADDIQRILCKINELLSKETKDITEYYYANFMKTLSEIVSRFDAYLEIETCHTLYQEWTRNIENTVDSTCLQELANMRPIDEISVWSTKEECRRRDRVSRIACVIIDKFPYFLRCILKKQYTPSQMYSNVAPDIRKYRRDQQTNLQDLSSLDTFDSLDITLLYQLLRDYSSVQAPTSGWGAHPVSSELTIGDDIERIRIFRNKFAHRSDIKMLQNTFEDYFCQFISVSHRIDVYLGNTMNPSCEQEVINCKTCNMDADLQNKYENALKTLENVKLRFEEAPLKILYGDSFERSLYDIRRLLKEEKIEGNEKIRIQIIVGNEAELNDAAPILNEMTEEINKGLIGIEIKKAYSGSVVLDVQIEVIHLETETKLQSVLNRFMQRILDLKIIKLNQSKYIEAVLVPIEDLSIAEKDSLSTESDTSLLYLDFTVDANMFATDERLQSILMNTVTNVLAKSNGKEKRKEINATLLPIYRDLHTIFVETPVAYELSQILQRQPFVLIVGEPGIGKSMLMHHIAENLQRNLGYQKVQCTGIKDVLHRYQLYGEQLFLVEDICGRYNVSISDLEYLMVNIYTFKKILNNGNAKIVATCRSDIYNDKLLQKTITSLTTYVLNLSEEYSREDKLKICSKYLTDEDVMLLRNVNVDYTPLMCYLYSKYNNINLIEFLQNPFKTYCKEWDNLKTIEPYKYYALFSCVIRNGTIDGSIFDYKYAQIMKDHEMFGINHAPYWNEMKTVLDSMTGTYLRSRKGKYEVIHNLLCDFLCCYFGNNDSMVRLIIHFADIGVINERTQLESLRKQHDKYTIMIPKKNEPEYFERIKHELHLGKIEDCINNSQMRHQEYRNKFLQVIHDTLRTNILIADVLLTNACFRGFDDIVQYLISKGTKLECSDADGHNTPLTAASMGENEKIVQLLIDNGADTNKATSLKQTPLVISCLTGNDKIVQILIENGANVDMTGADGKTPLTSVCQKSNEKIIQVLVKYGVDVNKSETSGHTPLTAACFAGNERIVHLLIENKADVNKTDEEGNIPLIIACQEQNEKIVKLLAEHGADVNTAGKSKNKKEKKGNKADVNRTDKEEKTPLLIACQKENEKIVQLLVEHGVDVNKAGKYGHTPLTAACYEGNDKIVQILIQAEADINMNDVNGNTPLIIACQKQNENILQLLLEYGVDVNKAGKCGATPLNTALNEDNERIVEILIKNKADVTMTDSAGVAPLVIACRKQPKEIVHLLVEYGVVANKEGQPRDTLLTTACQKGYIKIVRMLIEKKVDVNNTDKLGRTPLVIACEEKNEKIVQLLVENGVDVNKTGRWGKTPLIAACERGTEKIVQLLIETGAPVDEGDAHEQTPFATESNPTTKVRPTPLTTACMRGDTDIIRVLLDNGADVNKSGLIGKTPLVTACKRGNDSIVQLLINKGADVNQPDRSKHTPLTAACEKRNMNLINLLIDNGANVNLSDEYGQTPLTTVCTRGYMEVIKLLIYKLADVNLANEHKQTPLSAASLFGYDEVIQLLRDNGTRD